MAKSRSTVSAEVVEAWVEAAASAATTKNGNDTIALYVAEVLAITDWFVITDASNPRQLKAIVDEIEAKVDEAGGPKPRSVEGLQDLQWVLMDYGDFVVHVFVTDQRAFYELERLWADVPRRSFEDAPPAEVVGE